MLDVDPLNRVKSRRPGLRLSALILHKAWVLPGQLGVSDGTGFREEPVELAMEVPHAAQVPVDKGSEPQPSAASREVGLGNVED